MSFYVNFGASQIIRDGIYSIRTRDLDVQYYAVKRQSSTSNFAPNTQIVYKVEIVKSWHEQQMYLKNKWRIYSNDTNERVLAFKPFAFVSGNKIAVWKRFKNDVTKLNMFTNWLNQFIKDLTALNQNLINDLNVDSYLDKVRNLRSEYLTVFRGAPFEYRGHDLDFEKIKFQCTSTIMLWENHAQILEDFCHRHSDVNYGEVMTEGHEIFAVNDLPDYVDA